MPENLNTPQGIISWPHVFEPRAAVQGGEERFSCTLILNKLAQSSEQWQKIRREVAKTIDERWGNGKCRDQAFVRSLRMPWQPCSNKSQYAGFSDPDGIYISPWSKQQPQVFDRRKNLILKPDDVWAGQTAILNVRVWAYHQSANKGIGISLNSMQIVSMAGQRLDGRPMGGSEFEDLGDDEEAMATMSGRVPDDDEPPF